MSENLQEKIKNKVETTLNLRLERLAGEIVVLSENDDDNEVIGTELAFAAAFYTVCSLLEEG